MIGLGIDTGGTCTDAVIFDTVSKSVLSSVKTLTTKENLVVGIDKALGKIDNKLLGKIQFVSLSTTLATNACVENRGGRVKLIMIGHIPANKSEICRKYGFGNADDVYFLEGIPFGGFCRAIEPDWDKLEKDREIFSDCDAVGIVQSYPDWNDRAFEKRAEEILGKYYDIPIVRGSSLFTDINAYQRAAGTYLNARLIPLISEFIKAVRTAMSKCGIEAPVYIMRSDGTLMNEEFAKRHPVETLLCGPAASTMGGMFGQKLPKALIVDIGGTTTDTAIVENGIPVTIEDGIKINGWKTFVKGLYIDTFGLGGDTCVRYRGGKLYLEAFRVIPVSYIGSLDKSIPERIRAVAVRKLSKNEFYHEGFVLQKGITEGHYYTEKERKICSALESGPLLIHEIGEKLKLQVKSLPLKKLEEEGAIMRFGLTPTDIMHLKGDYMPYNVEAVESAVFCMSNFSRLDGAKIPDMVYSLVQDKLYRNLVRILLEYSVPEYREGISEELKQFLEITGRAGVKNALVPEYRTEYKIIGVGAPTHVFMPAVADRLNTEYIHHEYAGTANALGTLVGQISVKRELEILFYDTGYSVWIEGKEVICDRLEEAEQEASEYLKTLTGDIAGQRGLVGEIEYREEILHEEYSVYGDRLILKSKVQITAVGNVLPQDM